MGGTTHHEGSNLWGMGGILAIFSQKLAPYPPVEDSQGPRKIQDFHRKNLQQRIFCKNGRHHHEWICCWKNGFWRWIIEGQLAGQNKFLVSTPRRRSHTHSLSIIIDCGKIISEGLEHSGFPRNFQGQAWVWRIFIDSQGGEVSAFQASPKAFEFFEFSTSCDKGEKLGFADIFRGFFGDFRRSG